MLRNRLSYILTTLVLFMLTMLIADNSHLIRIPVLADFSWFDVLPEPPNIFRPYYAEKPRENTREEDEYIDLLHPDQIQCYSPDEIVVALNAIRNKNYPPYKLNTKWPPGRITLQQWLDTPWSQRWVTANWLHSTGICDSNAAEFDPPLVEPFECIEDKSNINRALTDLYNGYYLPLYIDESEWTLPITDEQILEKGAYPAALISLGICVTPRF